MASDTHLNELDSKSEPQKEEFIEFNLYPDVYVYFCLLYQNDHWPQLSSSGKFVVITFGLISLVIQTASMALLVYIMIGYEDDFSGGEMVYEIEYPGMSGELLCDGNPDASNCKFQESNFIYEGEVTAKDYVARVISMALVMCYVYSSIAGVSQYVLIIQDLFGAEKKKKAIPWMFIFCLQMLVIFVLLFAIARLVIFQTSLLDALSIGVGFVILMEVDDHVYEYAKNIPYQKHIDFDSFFHVQIERDNRNYIIRNGIFQYVHEHTFNILVFWGLLIAALWSIISLMYRWQMKYDSLGLMDGLFFILFAIPAFILPFVPIKKCACCKSMQIHDK
eukprot:130269_1